MIAKRILTKEKKIDRQLAGQSSFTLVMNIWEEHDKRVTLDTTESLEQKIDKLMVMMGLVSNKKMKDKIDSLNHKSINLTVAEDRQDVIINRENFRTGLGQTTAGTIHTEEGQCMDKIIKVGQDTILIIGVIMEIIWEVI